MERRKDTQGAGVKLPNEYLKMIEEVFNKNFKSKLYREAGKSETFIVNGNIFPDELVLCISLKHPTNLRMISCYASADYPPTKTKPETGGAAPSNAQSVEVAVGQCVDGIASFFATFFDEERPMDYDTEYRQTWTPVDIDKTTKIYILINRDNPELDAQADAFLEAAESVTTTHKKKKKNRNDLH